MTHQNETIAPQARYLIVTTGRSGSSLLSAILADAGADFGVPERQDWNRRSGWYEHPKLVSAYIWFRLWHSLPAPAQFARRFCQRRMCRELDTAMAEARFAKQSRLFYLVRQVHALGYIPQIMVSYRSPPGFLASRFKKSMMTVPEMSEFYYEVYSTALLQLGVFGGCAVSYEEMASQEETAWAEAVSSLTGLDCQRILDSRLKRVKSVTGSPEFPILDQRVWEVYEALQALRGHLVGPGSGDAAADLQEVL
jgi:hypothetical protein